MTFYPQPQIKKIKNIIFFLQSKMKREFSLKNDIILKPYNKNTQKSNLVRSLDKIPFSLFKKWKKNCSEISAVLENIDSSIYCLTRCWWADGSIKSFQLYYFPFSVFICVHESRRRTRCVYKTNRSLDDNKNTMKWTKLLIDFGVVFFSYPPGGRANVTASVIEIIDRPVVVVKFSQVFLTI